MKPKYLKVRAGVRYWEDATVNGVEDIDGSLIPFRDGPIWNPTIDILAGIVVDWPQGTTADIHYKVCDNGGYWLADESGKLTHQYGDFYVPSILSPGGEGYGDYIIMKVSEDGTIANWKPFSIDDEDWGEIP